MSDPRPISGPELQQLKQFWQEEDERNGGRSDTTRCILEIERLQVDNEYLTDTIHDAIQSLEFDEPSIARR